MQKKKIIIIGPAYPYRGGPSTYISYIYKILNNDFDVKIYNYTLLYPSFLFPGTTQYDKSQEKRFIVPSERIINSINPLNWIKTANKLKKENADLVIFDWWHPFFGPCHFTISFLGKKKHNGNILFITENYISHEQNIVDKILTKIGLSNADKFIALSEIVENELRKNFPGKKVYRSELPPFDLFTEKFDRIEERKNLGITGNDRLLLFFGYVRKYKGLDILLEAMPEILKKLPDVKLLIVGEFYQDINIYKELIDKNNLNDKVILINEFVPNEKVGKYFTASDAAVLPYRSATQSAVLNVSYSFNKPAIVTNVGGLGEFVKNNETGIIVEPGSAQEIVNGVIEFFKLRENIDFEKNIEDFKNRSKFNELPALLNEIINGG